VFVHSVVTLHVNSNDISSDKHCNLLKFMTIHMIPYCYSKYFC